VLLLGNPQVTATRELVMSPAGAHVPPSGHGSVHIAASATPLGGGGQALHQDLVLRLVPVAPRPLTSAQEAAGAGGSLAGMPLSTAQPAPLGVLPAAVSDKDGTHSGKQRGGGIHYTIEVSMFVQMQTKSLCRQGDN
jgi:hypothetical protein